MQLNASIISKTTGVKVKLSVRSKDALNGNMRYWESVNYCVFAFNMVDILLFFTKNNMTRDCKGITVFEF